MTGVSEAFAEGVRYRWIPGINSVASPSFSSAEQWLLKGAYSWSLGSNGVAVLTVSSFAGGLSDALASEVSRFSCAAYESLYDATSSSAERALGWSLVQRYYAAFYSAHALLRVVGTSLTFLSAQTTTQLNAVAGQYLGVSPNLSSGLYLISRDPTASNRVLLSKVAGLGGSHEELWKYLLAYVVDVENSLLANSASMPMTSAAVAACQDLRKALTRQGKSNGSWPSLVRNGINYRQDYRVWYPSSPKITIRTGLDLRKEKWKPLEAEMPVAHAADPLLAISDISNFLARALTAVLKDVVLRAPSPQKCFVEQVAFKYLKLKKVKM